MFEALLVIVLFSPLFVAVILAYQNTDWLQPFLREVWDNIMLMFRSALGIKPPSPPYEPPPIMYYYEDKLDAKVTELLSTRKRNPRLVRESLALREWQQKFQPPRRDPQGVMYYPRNDSDDVIVRSWNGTILRQDFRTNECQHDHTMVCYLCERK